MSDEGRKELSVAEAVAMLPETEMIHTFRPGIFVMIGCDWSRAEIIEAFEKYGVELSGPRATEMNHGVVFFDDSGAVFVATIPNNVSSGLATPLFN